MKYYRFLLADSPQDILLLNEVLKDHSAPVHLSCFTSLDRIFDVMNSDTDLVLIGSAILLRDGLDSLKRLGDIPKIILSESDGFRTLFQEHYKNLLIVPRTFDVEKVSLILPVAIEFCETCKGG